MAAIILTHSPIATFYAPGLGSCGHNNSENDFIVAVDIATITHFPGAGPNPNK